MWFNVLQVDPTTVPQSHGFFSAMTMLTNAHEDFRGQRLIILWKSLTVMAPTDSQDFNPDRTAFARLFYEEQGGAVKGRLEVSAVFARIMQSSATTLTPNDENGSNESLWNEKWNEVIWGPQLEMDQMESQAYSQPSRKPGPKAEARCMGAGASTGP